ncbi:hypothetical protein EDB85DRAFT_617494 [Lactarius pseudohatsudake]|nr:hypothetical protein EDB85DRAFT_617494 [Lactarius pseudohatsudake]
MHRFLSSDRERCDPYRPPQFYFSPFPYTPSYIGHRRDDGAPLNSSEVRNELRAAPHTTLPRSTRPTFYPQRQRIPCIFPRSEVRIASRGSKSRATHIMPGTYLHELWIFHERFRTCVNTDFQGFRKSSAMVKGLKCISRTSSGRIISHHIRGETHSRTHISSPTTSLSLPESMDVSQADVIIRSSDHVDFRVHKSILATSSPVFNDMFSLAQPSKNEAIDGFPIVQLSDDAELVRALITALPNPLRTSRLLRQNSCSTRPRPEI